MWGHNVAPHVYISAASAAASADRHTVGDADAAVGAAREVQSRHGLDATLERLHTNEVAERYCGIDAGQRARE